MYSHTCSTYDISLTFNHHNYFGVNTPTTFGVLKIMCYILLCDEMNKTDVSYTITVNIILPCMLVHIHVPNW